MRRRRTLRKPQRRNHHKRPQPPPLTRETLIEPSLLALSREINANPPSQHALTEQARVWLKEEAGRDITDWPGVPWSLVPFVQSLDLRRLAKILRMVPWFYWHRLVAGQLQYMLRICTDPDEWERLGWRPRGSEEEEL